MKNFNYNTKFNVSLSQRGLIEEILTDRAGSGAEWFIYDDESADAATRENIRESLWAFNMAFLKLHLKVTLSLRAEKALVRIQEELCDDANEIIFALVKDFDDLAADAIAKDGRGHFLSGYDCEEVRLNVGEDTFYCYRIIDLDFVKFNTFAI